MDKRNLYYVVAKGSSRFAHNIRINGEWRPVKYTIDSAELVVNEEQELITVAEYERRFHGIDKEHTYYSVEEGKSTVILNHEKIPHMVDEAHKAEQNHPEKNFHPMSILDYEEKYGAYNK